METFREERMAIIAMGAMGLGQALMGANSAKAQAGAARLQHQEQEFMRELNNQRENRAIAKKNAARYMQNKKIAQAANQVRAEEELYNLLAFDNATESFGKQFQSSMDTIFSGLANRNIRGKNARDILAASTTQAENVATSGRVSFGNRQRNAERRQQATLNKRDFGYTESIPFFPNTYYGPSESGAFNAALAQGVLSTAGSIMSFGAAGGNMNAGEFLGGGSLMAPTNQKI